MMKKRVLVVDDSEVALEVAAGALEDAGFEVHTAQSALGLTQLLRSVQPDCIVLDVAMPALSGTKSVEILRKHGGETLPILLHSDRPIVELTELARTCGADAAVTKSPDCRRLIAAVTRAVARLRPD